MLYLLSVFSSFCFKVADSPCSKNLADGSTPPKTNMEAMNGGLEDDCPLPKGRFSGFMIYVGFRGCKYLYN